MAIPMTLAQAKQNLVSQNRDYYNRKTWDTLLSQSTRAAETAEKQLVDQYTEASTEAYTSYLKNRSAIEGSNLYGDSKQNMLLENRINLEEAYNTYRQNLAKGEQEVSKQYQENVSAIDTELTKEAQNYLDYENLHYDYLKELFDKSPQLYNDPRFAQYITRDKVLNEETREWEIDPETGEYVLQDPRVKTVDELYNDMYTYNAETDEYEMNQAAVDYYDMIENLALEDIQGARSWQSFLEETNPELAEWAASTDQYNYTTAGTKAGSFKTITGRESTDFAWSYAERMTGVKASELNKQFTDFKETYEKARNSMTNTTDDLTAVKENVTNVANLTKEIGNLLSKYGIDQDIKNATGIDFDNLYDNLISASNSTDSTSGAVLSTIGDVLLAGAAGAGTGLGISAGVGAVGTIAAGPIGGGIAATLFAPIGAVIGAVTGIITSTINASKELDKKVSNANELNKQTEQMFNNLLVSISKYVSAKQTQSASSFASTKSGKLY